MQDQLHNYQTSTSKMAKSHIVREIIESVRRASPKGGFVKKVNGKWFDVGERARREKTGQQIRDLLHTQYRSSTKAKARTRKRLRKSHSANCATKAIARATAASMGMGVTMGSRSPGGSLPARIVTLDSDSSASSAAAVARSALAQYRRNSESDLAAVMAARASSSADRDINIIRDNEFSSLDLETSNYGYGMNRFNNMNMNVNVNMNVMNQASLSMGTSQGWGSTTMGAHDGSEAFPPLGRSGLSLQNSHQRSQLSEFSALLQHQQQHHHHHHQPHHPGSAMSQNTPFSHGGSSHSHSAFPSQSFAGNTFSTAAHAQAFDNSQSTTGIAGMNPAFRQQTNSQFSSPFGPANNVMMRGQTSMQSFASPSSNTRPQSTAFSDMYQRSGRMGARAVPNEDVDPLLYPVNSSFFKEESSNCQSRHTININHDDEDHDEESERSFEEAIDNIYTVDNPNKLP